MNWSYEDRNYQRLYDDSGDWDEDNNLKTGEGCQSCPYERVICMQEGRCLLDVMEAIKE